MNQLTIIFIFSVLFAVKPQAVDAQQPQGLEVNDVAPDFSSTDQLGNNVSLKKLLDKGPVVLVFYRGEWCPYCNKYLKELEESLLKVTAKGASIVAVTPEQPEYISKTIEKTKAEFSILHDVGLKIMKSYDVAYQLDEKTLTRYKKFSIDLTKINGDANKDNLPVPAVYVINKQGKIVYRFFDPDYTNRPPVSTIMKYL